MENEEIINYYKTIDFIPFRSMYMFIDNEDLSSYKIFKDNNLKVRYKKKYCAYRYPEFGIIFCTVWKFDENKFEKCMKELHNKIILCSSAKRYLDLCKEFTFIVNSNQEDNIVE